MNLTHWMDTILHLVSILTPAAPIVGGALAVLAALIRLYTVLLERRRALSPPVAPPRRGPIARACDAVRRRLRRTR